MFLWQNGKNPQSIQCIFIHILYLCINSFSSLKYSEVKDDGRSFKYSYSADRLHPSVGLTDWITATVPRHTNTWYTLSVIESRQPVILRRNEWKKSKQKSNFDDNISLVVSLKKLLWIKSIKIYILQNAESLKSPVELPKILRQEVQMIAPKSNPEQDQVEKDQATDPLTSPAV